MRIVAAVLLMVVALASTPASASERLEVYTARTTGELVIDTEGRVVELSLEHKALGDEVMKGFENQIRQWRFEPILQEGSPVSAKALMALDMVVIRQPGVDGLRLGFEQVQFKDPAQWQSDEKLSRGLKPPRYPREAGERSIGARVNLLLRLDEAGRVTHAAAESVKLLGDELGNAPARNARLFSRAAERAAADWQIPGIEGGVVVVPVSFMPYNYRGERWIRTRGMPVEAPAWVAIERASKEVIALGDGGTQSSERWKLLTPLDG